ncbi:MAG TPA: CCA tRNA nucleotidyltransferase, partial [Glaciihabitans sp.]|nr:CCA tRNA nucleotidyltransferase [Glaciihabitans sp.]
MDSVASALKRLGDLAASAPIARLASAFVDAGHELALVGGPVRDAFLGRTVSDLDFTTSASPDEIIAIVKPISSALWDVGRDFGTIGARVLGEKVEITTYRADVYDGETRKPVVQFGDTLEGDLVRRDFTVNSMALRLPQLQLVDPSGGVDDLLARTL